MSKRDKFKGHYIGYVMSSARCTLEQAEAAYDADYLERVNAAIQACIALSDRETAREISIEYLGQDLIDP